MFSKIFKKVFVLMTITVIVSGCSFIDDKKSEIEELARQKRQELEKIAQQKKEEIKQNIQDEIDDRIDEMAEKFKDNMNIMGEGSPRGIDEVSESEANSGETENSNGIELGEIVE